MAAQLLDHHGNPIERQSRKRELADFSEAFARSQRKQHGRYDAAGSGDLDPYWANADAFDADSAHSPHVRGTLVRRSRYEVTNNGYSDGIAQTYATDLVGTGPQLRMQTNSSGFNQLVERTWFLWTKAVSFRRKLWTMAHAKHVDGEALAILRINPKIRHPIKLDLSLRETEQCCTPFPPFNDPTYIDGIKLDNFENPEWYDFLRHHPGSSGSATYDLTPFRVPANRVLHWFKMRRPGQHRGVPECASTLNLGAAFRRLREASLSTAEKVAAWTLFLKTMFQPEELQGAAPMSTLDVVQGMMTALPNNMEPHQLTAEQPGPQYEGFHRSLLSEQARPKCMSYNKAACDSKDSSYASGRLDFLPYFSALDIDREDGNELVLDALFDVWFDLAIPTFRWLGGNAEAVGPAARFHLWDWPKHQAADIGAEASANETKLKTGQIFVHRLFSDAGMDFEDEAEAAAVAFGVPVEELKTRLLDVLFPPPKATPPSGNTLQEPAMAALLTRAFNVPPKANGAHHDN